MDTLRRPSAPAFAPTGRGKQGMTVIKFFANHSVWSIMKAILLRAFLLRHHEARCRMMEVIRRSSSFVTSSTMETEP